MATNKDILGLLKTLGEVYGQEPEAAQIKGYIWALEGYDADVLEATAKDAVRFCKWFPKPSELREIAERKQNAKDKDEQPQKYFWRMTELFGDWLTGRIPDEEVKTIAALDKYFGMPHPEPVKLHDAGQDDVLPWPLEGMPRITPIPGKPFLADARWLEQYYSFEFEELTCEA